MAKIRLLVAAMLGFSISVAPSRAADVSHAVPSVVENFVRPAHEAFKQRAGALVQAMDALCAAPSQEALAAARGAFRGVALGWGRVEIVRFGPVTEANRLERALFFPDRKGAGLRQVQAVLAKRDVSATDSLSLAGKSVAMQGLPALEFLLWGTGADALAGPGAGFRCAYGRAVAENLADIGAELDKAWDDPQGFASIWASPGLENPLYRNSDEALGELVGAVVEGLERLRDQRLQGFLGETPDNDRPKQALFWRSGLTLAMAEANLQGMAEFWAAAGLGAGLPPDQNWIANSIRFEFGNALGIAAQLATVPVEQVLTDPDTRNRLSYLLLVTSSLSDIFGSQLSPALDLSTGFSSLDGD